jgi:wobble nucleotide-excising tRNase
MDEISNAKTKVEDLENEIKNIDKRLESIKDISNKSNTELVKVYENAITFYKNLVMAYKIYIKTFEKNM